MTLIETARLYIRKIRLEDFERLLSIYQVPENMRFILSGRADYRMEELKEKWEKMGWSDQRKAGFWIIEHKESGLVIGEAGFLSFQSTPEKELELAYLIDQAYWGQGFGKEICRALIDYGFEVLNMDCLKAGMYQENHRSAQLVQKLGFRLRTKGTTAAGIHFQDYVLQRDQNR